MAKDKDQLISDLGVYYPDNDSGEISASDCRGQQSDVIEALMLQGDALAVFAFAAYGSISFSGPPASLGTVGSSWQTFDQTNTLIIATPLGITPDLAAGSLSAMSAGVYMLTVGGSFSHDSSNDGRETSIRVYNTTDGAALGDGFQVGVGRNVAVTSFNISVPLDIPAGSVNKKLAIQIGGGDTLSGAELTAFAYTLHGIGEFRGTLPSMD